MKLSLIFLILALVMVAIYACFVVSGWWSREEEKAEKEKYKCETCTSYRSGNCDGCSDKENPCACCYRKEHGYCEGCPKRIWE